MNYHPRLGRAPSTGFPPPVTPDVARDATPGAASRETRPSPQGLSPQGLSPQDFSGRERFVLLDALRGIAALAVLVFHVGTRAAGPHIVYNGYLAVDFFFMLSGFVIAEAYEQRLRHGMGLGPFALRRLIRMMPVVALGVGLGLAYGLARAVIAPPRSDPMAQLAASALLSLFLLPKWWHGPSSGWELFPVNGPLWSLFFEIGINLVWAALLVGRRTGTLIMIAGASAIGLVCLALWHRTMDMGWQLTSLDGGLARVTFGFVTGLVLHRLHPRWPELGRWAAWLACAVLLYALLWPVEDPRWTAFAAIVLLPCALILAICAGRHRVVPAGAFLGAISYPLYGIHVPLLAICSGGLEKITGLTSAGWWSLLAVPPILALAWLALRFYEVPARAALNRLSRRRAAAGCPAAG